MTFNKTAPSKYILKLGTKDIVVGSNILAVARIIGMTHIQQHSDNLETLLIANAQKIKNEPDAKVYVSIANAGKIVNNESVLTFDYYLV